MNILKKVTLAFAFVFSLQTTYACASDQQNKELSLHADRFSVLKEGFALCGLYNLTEFFNEKLEEFDVQQSLQSTDKGDQDCLVEDMCMMDKVNYAVESAENLIVERFSHDSLSQKIFCNKLTYIINNNLELDAQPTPYLSLLQKPDDQIADKFFQYCIQAQLMQPVRQKYITDFFAPKDSKNIKQIIQNNKASVFELLIKYEISLKIVDPYEGPCNLYSHAAKHKSWNIIPVMLANNIPGSYVALCNATVNHENDAVRQLIRLGVNVNNIHEEEVSTMSNTLGSVKKNNTVFDYALWNDNSEIMPYLKLAQQKASLTTDEERYVMNEDDFDTKLYDSNTPLHLAVLNRDTDKISSLLADGADLHAKNSDGKIPWDLAVSAGMRSLLRPPTVMQKKATEATPLLQSTTINNPDKDKCSIS